MASSGAGPTADRRAGVLRAASVLGEQVLFAAAVFVGAFLIFLVQPMVGKRILPWFGGAPAVWTLCLAFYQSVLFLGYAWAHLLIRFLAPGWQVVAHGAAVALALVALPVLPDDTWQPHGVASPSGRILAMLAANVALPFLVLASTGPLAQAWFARRHPQRSPYPLYAVSNAASLAALLAYPFVIEPRLALSRTGDLWSAAFVAGALAVLACAVLAWRSTTPVGGGHQPAGAGDGAAVRSVPRVALWFLLAACAVVLLMGVTNKLCIDIASVPFLWIVPLATYLLTFVLCFGSERIYRRGVWLALAGVSLVPTTLLWAWIPSVEDSTRALLQSPPVQIGGYCALLLSVCMVLHGELYRLRPPIGSLTAFYLSLSAGGALGGIFVGIVAPRIFEGYHELDIGMGLGALLVLVLWSGDPESRPRRAGLRRTILVAGLVGLAAYAGLRIPRPGDALVFSERSFFGVYRVFDQVSEDSAQRNLMHGTTLHGIELLGRWRRVPTSYFGRATGLGLALGGRDDPPGQRLGVIGLGVGTLASYAREGDSIRFYEIDPLVVQIARDDGLFHFLVDCPAEVEVVVGDARLALADEQRRGAKQDFDYLVVDAFNSDAIPVHLLTVEAFARYVRALAPGGLLAVHVSSRHFDLVPLVLRVGREQGLHGLQITNARAPRLQSRSSQWVWMSRGEDGIRALAQRLRERHAALGLRPESLRLYVPGPDDLRDVPVWTDDYSDLFSLLRKRG